MPVQMNQTLVSSGRVPCAPHGVVRRQRSAGVAALPVQSHSAGSSWPSGWGRSSTCCDEHSSSINWGSRSSSCCCSTSSTSRSSVNSNRRPRGPQALQAARQPPRPSAASVSSQPTSAADNAASDASGSPQLASLTSLSSFEEVPYISPEDFELPPGVLSEVDRSSPPAPEDTFRCTGCTRTECQGPSGCAATPWRFTDDGYLRAILTARVYEVAELTPLDRAAKLSDALGSEVLLKREDLQPVFSFKLRGAYNKMAQLSPEALARGVITSSAGNHAQGVALAAAKLGCTAVICMPVNTPEIKVASVRRLGGTVQLVGESYQEAQAAAQARALEEGLTFVAPYDDPYTIAGQGTIADEILRQATDPASLDAIFVAIGGGGLIAGIAAYVKALHPHISVIGVEPCGANAMAMSLQQGRRIALSRVDAFADGVAVKYVGAETFRMCRQHVDGVLLVDNAAISAAIKDVFEESRCILEPAGAVALAGAKAWLTENGHKGKRVVAVTSGANMNFERLRLVSELADLGASREVMMATTIPERPGAFSEFVDAAIGGSTMNVTEFKYRYSAGPHASILWSAGVKVRDEVTQAMARLEAAGMPTIDISNMANAQVHLRHLVGGRARSYMGEIPNERIWQVSFPERPGALRRFLDTINPQWNVTLFHYRNTGNRESSVLLGLQVPPEQERMLMKAGRRLENDEFSFEELTDEERRVFNMFIQ